MTTTTMTAQDWSDVLRYCRRDLDEAIQYGADATEQRFLRAAIAYAEDKRDSFRIEELGHKGRSWTGR